MTYVASFFIDFLRYSRPSKKIKFACDIFYGRNSHWKYDKAGIETTGTDGHLVCRRHTFRPQQYLQDAEKAEHRPCLADKNLGTSGTRFLEGMLGEIDN